MTQQRVLLIGDADRQIYSAVSQALPTAQVRSVATIFDGLAELTHEQYTTVLAAAEPIERRPEAAVKSLRELTGEGRLLLFGHPTLEPLSQKMLDFGCDDYLVTPVTPGELLETLSATSLRLRRSTNDLPKPRAESPLSELPLLDIVLDALLQFPQESVDAVLKQIKGTVGPAYTLTTTLRDAAAPAEVPGSILLSRDCQSINPPRKLHLLAPEKFDRAAAEHFLAELDRHLARIGQLQERHNALMRLGITDSLTGLSNGRYFRHFLEQIIEKARVLRFPVTLFLFDIDNFKRYNDQYGHGVGDEILKQTAALMRRCVRDHDHVARISGDEFAVVFWEKEGPRQPREPRTVTTGRTPQEPQEILDRFRRLLATQDFPGLGPGGKGCLTISGGLAVFPWNAQDANGLIDAADKQLMFGAKRAGRNSIRLVGGEELPHGCEMPEQEKWESEPEAGKVSDDPDLNITH